MPTKKQKLELTWIGKENRPKLEPRILVEDPEKSYHAPHRVGENDLFDNKLIFGDNLLALKALEQDYAGKVKCVFIDPPYQHGSAFEHYDDGLEHSMWLRQSETECDCSEVACPGWDNLDNIDDNEAHYLKVLCDEVFGRSQFWLNIVTWQTRPTCRPEGNQSWLCDTRPLSLFTRKGQSCLVAEIYVTHEKQQIVVTSSLSPIAITILVVHWIQAAS